MTLYTLNKTISKKNVERQFRAVVRRNKRTIYKDLLTVDTLYKGEEMRLEGSSEIACKLVSSIVHKEEERETVIKHLTSIIYDMLNKEDSMSLLMKADLRGIDLNDKTISGYNIEKILEMKQEIEENVNKYNETNNTNKGYYMVAYIKSKVANRYVNIMFVDVERADGTYYFTDLINPKHYTGYRINRLKDDPIISRYRVVMMTVKRKYIPMVYEAIEDINIKIYMDGYREAYEYQLRALNDDDD